MACLWQRLRGIVDAKLLKFLLVGVINTLVGVSIELFLYNVLHCGVWFSSATNYVLTSILSFFLNKHFTFRNKENSWRQVLRFAANIAVCYLLAHGIAVPLMEWLLAGMRGVSSPVWGLLPSFVCWAAALMVRAIQVLMKRAEVLQTESDLTV